MEKVTAMKPYIRNASLVATLVVVGFTSLSGCAPNPVGDTAYAAAVSQTGREAAMRKRWADKPYRELVKERGHEGLVMDIPRYGWPPSSAVVFGIDDASGCVDAFLVVHGKEPLIKDYFCR
jgi:hypothetical protein